VILPLVPSIDMTYLEAKVICVDGVVAGCKFALEVGIFLDNKEKFFMKTLCTICIFVAGFFLLGSGSLFAQENVPPEVLGGADLPNPLGVGVTFYNQNQPYQTESLYVEFPGLDQSLLQNLDVENETTTFHLRLDYWLLPFINVFGIVGNIDSSTKVALSSVDLGPYVPVTLTDLKIDLDGTVYGGGLVAAYGGKKWFGTVAYQLTETNLENANSSISAWVLTPKAGLRFKKGAAWVGAMYQNAQEEHGGIFNLEGVGDVPYDVKLKEQKPWNFVVGGTYGFSKHWLVTAQAGFGDRMSALGMVEYRF
jgi:hypothetical protein